MRKLLAVVVMLALAAPFAFGGNLDMRRYMLFNGDAFSGAAATDTAEHVSPWIPVQGATRIFFRSWSAKAAFHVSTDADSLYTDTITVFRVAFTDSVSNVNPLVGADSIAFAGVDTTVAQAIVTNPPVNQQLRGPGNGSGVITWVMPVNPGLITADNNGVIPKRYMRVYYTPLARSTAATSLATAPNRANRGLKFFRMEAVVVKANQ